jgi:pyruvate carboxylase
MVGDLAIFMAQNDLTADNIVERGEHITFPDSVVSYFKGMMGQPAWGFPEDIQKVVLKGEEPITCRPGQLLKPVDWDEVRKTVSKLTPEPTQRDFISWCLYPKVLEDYFKHRKEYGDIHCMDTHIFFKGMMPGETTELTIEDGKTLVIKYVGLGETNSDGTQNILFELNGARREIAVKNKTVKATGKNVVLADPEDKSQVGTSIPGAVSKVMVKAGDKVTENQVLAIIEAMKMETSIVSRINGTVDKILVSEGSSVKAGELLMTLK